MTADAGADQRAMLALQARVSEALAQLARTTAEIVKLKGQVAALSLRVAALESAAPSPNPPFSGLPVDPNMPSKAEQVAMRKRLHARTAAGIAANKTDRYRAGRTYQRDRKLLTDVE